MLPIAREPKRVVIDANNGQNTLGPTHEVAGLPLIVRVVRQAARAGATGVVIEGGDREAIAATLSRWRLQQDFPIDFVPTPAATSPLDHARLQACAVYDTDQVAAAVATGSAPEPVMRVKDHRDAREVTRELVRRTAKNIDADGVVAYYVFRPISRAITRVLIHTRISANAVTLTALALGIAAAICAGVGGVGMVSLAGILYWIGAVVDCVDGELARLRMQGSKLGEWMDTLADDLSTFGLLAGIGVGMVRDGYPEGWGVAAAVAAAVGFSLSAKLYFDLARWGMVIDTAKYPWFFGTPATGDHGRKGLLGRMVYAVNFLFRRDAVATMVAILLVIGLREIAVGLLLLGVAVFSAMFFIHGVVISVRRKPGEESFWTVGYFGIKDLFTIINLLGGVGAIYFALAGRLDYAGYSIFAGYLFGDVLDGPVARWTRTSNRFGKEFDAAADHVAQSIVPAIIVYVGFAQTGHQLLGLSLLALLITTASIRQARFAVAPFEFPLTYCGLPRTVSGLVALSLPNSILFFEYSPVGHYGAAAVVVLVSVLNLAPIPYMTHKGRKMQGYVKSFVVAFLLVPPVMIVFAPRFVFDFIFVVTFGYALMAWIPLRPSERREFFAIYQRWATQVRQT